MNVTAHCPQCGAAMPASQLEGLCMRCVARQARAILATRTGGASAPFEPTRPRYFGDYELLEEIARGGMGVVWKASQISLHRTVAVKMLLAGRFSSPEFVQRFRAEAEAVANLQHPNIVAIYEVGEHGGQQYFSMEFVDGQSLAERARDNPLPPEMAADYVRTIAEAIHYAHQRGILHRDLKPSNVLIDAQDHPRVTDFGLAKRLTGSELGPPGSELTLTGQVLGTPNYMSPEQAQGRRGAVTVASDVYSLGALLYFLVTGRAPFAAETLEETLRQVHDLEAASPRQWNPTVPRDLETINLKCLNKEPSRRYPTAQELADDLGRFLAGEPIHALPVGPAGRLWRWCRRKPALAASIAALHLVAVAGLAGILWEWGRAEQNASAAQQQSLRAEQHAVRETAQRLRAETAVTALELQRAEDLLEKDEAVMGVAYLARMVRQQPGHRIAAQRLLSALAQRHFALPVGAPLQHGALVNHAEFSADGRRVVTASKDLTARVWDAASGAPLTPPMLHSNTVATAHFSPDGERLLTVTRDSGRHVSTAFQARLWIAASGEPLGAPMEHAQRIRSAAFSPDGQRVLTASEDGTARLWDAHTGEPLLHPLRHQGPVRSARFSPDGRQIVTASEDRTAQVWQAQTGQPAAKPFLHQSAVLGADFSPDGQRVVTMAKDFSTCVWDVKSGEPVARPLRHSAETHTACFSPEGERIITASHDGVTRIWSARDWTPLTPPMRHRGGVSAAEFGPESQRVLTGSIDNTARLWNSATGEPLTPPMQHDGLVWSARLSPDGLLAVTASADKTARIWDVRLGGERSQVMTHDAPVSAAEFSPDGEWFVTGARDGTARIWNSRTGQHHGLTLQHANWVLAVQFSPNGKQIATGSADRTARIWDAQTGAPLTAPLQHGAPVDRVEFSPGGQILATACRLHTNVWLWNTQTGDPCAEPIRTRAEIHVLCFSPDGQRLLSDDFRENTAQIRDVKSGKLLVELRGHEGFLFHGEFSPDAQRVLTASEDGTARIWNAHTGHPLAAPMRHKAAVQSARFGRDGRWAVTASDDMTAQVWDTLTAQPRGEPLRLRDSVVTAEFSPDAMLVVTASRDGTARLWDASTGRPVAEPFVHSGRISSARFSPDGRRVLTASDSGSAQLWDVPPTVSFDQPRPLLSSFPSHGGEGARRAVEGDAGVAGTLLADLAEAVIGKCVNLQGAIESVSPTNLLQVRQRVSTLPREADFTRWLEWFLADRSTRTISPYSPMTVPQYLVECGFQTTFRAWQEGLMLEPRDNFNHARLAEGWLHKAEAGDPAAPAYADWASRRAIELAPEGAWPWMIRTKFHERAGAWAQLLSETERALTEHANSPYLWQGYARALEALSRFEEMAVACDRGLETWEKDPNIRNDRNLQREFLIKRSIAHTALGHRAEAIADRLAHFGLPPRDPQAGTNLIDLGLHYNGVTGEDFPFGLRRLAGTDFDFRGWIQLDARRANSRVTNLPERVNDVPIERQCRRLHFLHAVGYSSPMARTTNGVPVEAGGTPLGAVVARYVIHYADGRQLEIPIVYGRDLSDYWHFPESAPDDPALVVAWTGSSPHSRQSGARTRLYKQTWENPRPDITIRSLDFVHAQTHAVPILAAIAAEP